MARSKSVLKGSLLVALCQQTTAETACVALARDVCTGDCTWDGGVCGDTRYPGLRCFDETTPVYDSTNALDATIMSGTMLWKDGIKVDFGADGVVSTKYTAAPQEKISRYVTTIKDGTLLAILEEVYHKGGALYLRHKEARTYPNYVPSLAGRADDIYKLWGQMTPVPRDNLCLSTVYLFNPIPGDLKLVDNKEHEVPSKDLDFALHPGFLSCDGDGYFEPADMVAIKSAVGGIKEWMFFNEDSDELNVVVMKPFERDGKIYLERVGGWRGNKPADWDPVHHPQEMRSKVEKDFNTSDCLEPLDLRVSPSATGGKSYPVMVSLEPDPSKSPEELCNDVNLKNAFLGALLAVEGKAQIRAEFGECVVFGCSALVYGNIWVPTAFEPDPAHPQAGVSGFLHPGEVFKSLPVGGFLLKMKSLYTGDFDHVVKDVSRICTSKGFYEYSTPPDSCSDPTQKSNEPLSFGSMANPSAARTSVMDRIGAHPQQRYTVSDEQQEQSAGRVSNFFASALLGMGTVGAASLIVQKRRGQSAETYATVGDE